MLPDGRAVIVRPVPPQDVALIRSFFQGLSPASRRLRFHTGVSKLPDPLLRDFAELDYAEHLALLAEVIDDDGEERQAGDARFSRRAARCCRRA